MEVHKHPHHVTHKKKWSEYLLEFFMLFLAVFLGFVAENVRENSVENHREKQYIISMLEDLKSDTAQLNHSINFRKVWRNKMDSLSRYLQSPDIAQHGKEIYYNAKSISRGFRFLSNDRTIQQLKNAGNLRLIHNQLVSDSIMQYDQNVRRILYHSEMLTQLKYENRHLAGKLFNAAVLEELEFNRTDEFPTSKTNPPLLIMDSILINEFLVDLLTLKKIDSSNQNAEESLCRIAVALMNLIKKEYHLD